MRTMLVQRRWLALTVLAVLLAAMCVRLGFWQLHRHQARSAANAVAEANTARPPVPVADLLAPGREAGGEARWRAVSAVGRYDAANTVLVRNRTFEGRTGVNVVVPLVTPEGTALLVDRGFVRRTAGAETPVDVPAPPPGEVTVVGAVRAAEGSGTTPVATTPQRSAGRLDVPAIAAALPYPVFGSAVDLREERPAPAQAPAPPVPPEIGIGPHLSYAIQWWVFALFAVGGWVLLLRRDLREDDPGGGRPASLVDTDEPAGRAVPARAGHEESTRWPD